MGIEDSTQLFFIDGQPAYDYVEKLAGRPLSPDSQEDQILMKAEISAAILSAEHRIEMAKVGMDEYGAFQVGVVSVQPDLTELDGQEKWYQKKPSAKAEKLYDNDPDREQRISDIRRFMGEKLVTAETRRLRQEEDPYRRAKTRFSLTRGGNLSGSETTKLYFGDRNIARLERMKGKLPSDMARGSNKEMGGS